MRKKTIKIFHLKNISLVFFNTDFFGEQSIFRKDHCRSQTCENFTVYFSSNFEPPLSLFYLMVKSSTFPLHFYFHFTGLRLYLSDIFLKNIENMHYIIVF